MTRRFPWLKRWMFQRDYEQSPIADIEWGEFAALLQYRIRDKALFSNALRHSSHETVERDNAEPYERLEFLGDAVLDLIVARHLYRRYPYRAEGDLTKMRSCLVNQKALAHCARKHGLGAYIQLGVGERKTGGMEKVSILCDVVEAVIGAMYLDSGEEAARRFIHHFILADFHELLNHGQHRNYKGELLEYCQQSLNTIPKYVLVSQEGLAHSKIYTMEVLIKGEVQGAGAGSNKKEAEQRAAENALQGLNLSPPLV